MSDLPEVAGITDLHSHLIPGVDDGAPTLEDALEGIGRMVALGVRSIVTTPHLDGSLTRDTARLAARLHAFDRGFAELAGAVGQVFPDLKLARGCEIMMDRPDPDLSHPGVRLAETGYILMEWPGLRIPPGTAAVVRGMRAQGVEILIAHPERYSGYDEPLSAVSEWRAEGAFLQMNYGSLVGRFGGEVRTRALRMLERGWVDCLASDFHGRPALGLFIEESRSIFQGMDAAATWELLTRTNPGRISRGEAPLPVLPVKVDRSVLARLRSLFGE